MYYKEKAHVIMETESKAVISWLETQEHRW